MSQCSCFGFLGTLNNSLKKEGEKKRFKQSRIVKTGEENFEHKREERKRGKHTLDWLNNCLHFSQKWCDFECELSDSFLFFPLSFFFSFIFILHAENTQKSRK